MRAEGVNVEDPDNAGEYIALDSDWSPVMTGTPGPRPPGAPQELSVAPGDASITATWAAPEDSGDPELDGYIFQWRETGASPPAAWQSAVLLAGLEYSPSELMNGQEYEAQVAAFHDTVVTAPAGVTVTYVLAAPASGTACPTDTDPTADCYVVIADESIGNFAGPLTATPGAERPPGVPQNLRVAPGDGSITALWDAPQDTGNPVLDGYVFQWRPVTTPESDWQSFVTRSTEGDYELDAEDGIVNDQEYEVRVAAFHKTVLSDATVQVEYVLDAADVPAPEPGEQALPACPTDGSQPTADCYVVVPPANIGPYTDIAKATPSALPTIQAVVAEDAPDNLGLTPGVGQITVTWDAPAEDDRDPAHSGYVVQYRAVGNTQWTDGPRIIYTTTDPEPTDTDTRSATITGLAEGTYEVRVGTLLQGGAVLGSFTQPQRAIVRVPGSPRNVVLVPGPGQLTAQWDAPEDRAVNHAGYVVQYRAVGSTQWIEGPRIVYGDADDDPNTPDVDETPESRSVTITLAEGAYEVRVGTLLSSATLDSQGRTIVGQVPGVFTAPVTAEAKAQRTPGPPLGLGAVIEVSPNDGSRSIYVYWNAPADQGNPPLTGYSVQYRRVGDAGWTDWTRAPSETASGFRVWITGIGSHNDWEVRVAAVGPVWETGAWANSGKAPRPPGAVASLTLTPGDGQITAEWEAPEDPGNPPFSEYSVFIRRADAALNIWQRVGETGTSRTLTGLTNGQEYLVQVRASNGAGYGPPVTLRATPTAGDGGTVTNKPDPNLPGAPRNLTLTAGYKWIVVEWDTPEFTGNPELHGYRIRYREAGSESAPTTLWHDDLTVNAITIDSGLTNGQQYEVWVNAVHTRDGEQRSGPAAGPAKARPSEHGRIGPPYPERQPSAPRDLTLTAGDGEITVSWEPPERLFKANPGYLVEYRKAGANRWIEEGEFRDTSATIGHLENGTAYEVRVTVFDTHGEATAGPKEVTTLGDSDGGDGGTDNQPPTANAGPDQSVNAGDTVTLAGSGTDPDGQTLTYAWTAPSGITLSSATAARPTFTAPDRTADYTLTFSLVVNDGSSDSAADTVVISVTVEDDSQGGEGGDGGTDNQPPTANAGPDQTVKEGDTVTLAGSGTDPEGQTLTYAWTAPSGITLSSATAARPTFTAPDRTADYTLTFSLVVNDGTSDSAPDTVVISVTVELDPERPPTAPRDFSLTAGDEHIGVSWTEPEDIGEPDDFLGYIVEIREVGESEWFEWGHYEGTSATVDYLENGKTYEVRVQSFNLWGEAYTGVLKATPKAGS